MNKEANIPNDVATPESRTHKTAFPLSRTRNRDQPLNSTPALPRRGSHLAIKHQHVIKKKAPKTGILLCQMPFREQYLCGLIINA